MPHPIPVYQAIILGIVQGITEFLPVSSTAHLRLIPRLFGWHDGGLAFDAALHTGTLIALLIYFWRDWIDVTRPIIAAIHRKRPAAAPHFGRNLIWGIIIGCIPAGVAGLMLNDTIDKIELSKNPATNTAVMVVVATALIVVGVVLYLSDKYGSRKKQHLAQMNSLDFVVIGFAQALALVWGVSRSGATISAGRIRGLDRDAAARFSFLLSTPIFIAVAGLHIKDVLEQARTNTLPPGEIVSSLVGLVSSAVVGVLVIRFLLNYLRRHSVNVFVWYRIALGVVILGLVLTNVV